MGAAPVANLFCNPVGAQFFEIFGAAGDYVAVSFGG